MSRQRRLTGEDVRPSLKGPHGNRQCRWCKAEVFPPNRTYCGPNCVHEWKLRSDSSYLRSQLYLRDKGVCRGCGQNTQELRLMLYKLTEQERVATGGQYGVPPHNARTLQLWEADHIVAVCNGGGLAGLDNYQTLCISCHRTKTQMDLKHRRGNDVAVQEEEG